jgi:predicted nucleic acid-binding protein
VNEAVIDASVVLRWAFEDELDREGATRIADALAEGRLRAIAPPTFLAEVAGVLVRALRADRIDSALADVVMTALLKIAIDTDEPHGYGASAMGIALARGLHVQDAMYLETAQRFGFPLVSADRQQLEAARGMRLAAIALNDVPAWIPDSP